jgi:hypothetical protein
MSRAADRNRFQKDAEAKYLTSSRMDFSVGTGRRRTQQRRILQYPIATRFYWPIGHS